AAAERASRKVYLEEITERLGRFASGAVPDGVESLLPRVWDRERDALATIVPALCTVVIFDSVRATDEAAKAVEHEEELASLWSDPARLAEDLTHRPERHRDEEGVLHLPLDAVIDDLRAAGRDVWQMQAY